MVVEGIMPSPRAHFLCAVGHGVDGGPIPLNPFAVCPAHTWLEVHRVRDLALEFVRGTVTLWNAPINLRIQRNVHLLRQHVHSSVEFDFVLAGDVVGNK